MQRETKSNKKLKNGKQLLEEDASYYDYRTKTLGLGAFGVDVGEE